MKLILTSLRQLTSFAPVTWFSAIALPVLSIRIRMDKYRESPTLARAFLQLLHALNVTDFASLRFLDCDALLSEALLSLCHVLGPPESGLLVPFDVENPASTSEQG